MRARGLCWQKRVVESKGERNKKPDKKRNFPFLFSLFWFCGGEKEQRRTRTDTVQRPATLDSPHALKFSFWLEVDTQKCSPLSQEEAGQLIAFYDLSASPQVRRTPFFLFPFLFLRHRLLGTQSGSLFSLLLLCCPVASSEGRREREKSWKRQKTSREEERKELIFLLVLVKGGRQWCCQSRVFLWTVLLKYSAKWLFFALLCCKKINSSPLWYRYTSENFQHT